MYSSNLVQLIFLIAALVLFGAGLYFAFIRTNLRVPGIILLCSSIVYFGLTFLLFYTQSQIDNIGSQSSNVKSSQSVVSSGTTPVTSSSTAGSRFLNIPVLPVQNVPIEAVGATVAADISSSPDSTGGGSGKITATVDNPKPTIGQTVNVIVNGPVGTYVYATANYKNASVSNSGVIGSTGSTKISFAMGNSTPGETVKVDVNGTLNNNAYTAQTSFTEAN